MKSSRCKSCNNLLDAATNTARDKRSPIPEDISICFSCGHLQVFGDDLSLRDLTGAEMYDIAGDPDILQAQKIRGFCTEYKIHYRNINNV